jgi:PAS domain S-box-containing protein
VADDILAPPLSIQSLLASIVRSSDDAIISKDLKSIVTSWNPAAEQMFGYTAEEMIGRSIRTIIPPDRQHEEDTVLGRIKQGLAVDHYETIRMHKSGAPVHISLSVSPIRDAAGTVVGASKIARDISERLRAQAITERARRQAIFLARLTTSFSVTMDYNERLKKLAALAVPDLADWCAVDAVTANGRIESVAITHADPDKIALAGEIRERHANSHAPGNPVQVIRTGKPAIVLTTTDEMLVDGAAGDQELLRLVRSLGLVSYVSLPLAVHGNTLGALTFATAESSRRYDEDAVRFLEDVASRAALALDNSRSYEQLQAANRMKDEFLATLSHELRTPLNAILGYARMLRSGMVKEDKKESALDTLERNATSLTQIVEDVLDVSRIAAGKIRLNVQSFDLPVVLHDALATVMPGAEAKGVRIQSIVDPDIGPISGDPDRLQQVMWNLFSNAVKFTPRGGRVQVRLRRVDSHIEISVSDTGVGIRADFLPHLFERFRQADSSTTRAHGGLGLGLAIARQIVELHGGTIQALSDGEGKGATFRIELPAMTVHPTVVAGEEPRVHPRAPVSLTPMTDHVLSHVRVLAVDDDADALTLVREILETAGAQVFTASSAPAALVVLEEQSPDVLISDLGMPWHGRLRVDSARPHAVERKEGHPGCGVDRVCAFGRSCPGPADRIRDAPCQADRSFRVDCRSCVAGETAVRHDTSELGLGDSAFGSTLRRENRLQERL